MMKPKSITSRTILAFIAVVILFSAVIMFTPSRDDEQYVPELVAEAIIEEPEAEQPVVEEPVAEEPPSPATVEFTAVQTQPDENLHWVGTWGTSNYFGDPASGNGGIRDAGNAALTLPNATLRQMLRTAIAGETIRLTFSNQFGEAPLTINATSIALANGNPGTSGIDTSTNTAVTFNGGERRVVIPPGEFVTSDDVNFPVDALQRIAVSTYFGDMPEVVVSHIAARANSFVQPGNNVNNATITGTQNTHWFVIAGIDVLVPTYVRSIVVIGDSLTDGFGITNEAYLRWVDILMNNLQANDATRHLSVINMGRGGNGLVGSAHSNPPAVRHLFYRDVLEQPGIGYVVFQIGVNNLAFSPNVSFDAMIQAYTEMINLAHAQGIKVFAGTIGAFNFTDANRYREDLRQDINNWMRQQYAEGRIYGLIDIDKVLRDPDNIHRFLPSLNRDGIHPNNAGYARMGEAMFEILYANATSNINRLTVSSPSGNATQGGYYATGANITLNAGAAPEGLEFRDWISYNPEVEFDDPTSPTTNFVMPAASTSVVARFSRIGGDPCDNSGFVGCEDCEDWEFADGMTNGLRVFSVRPAGGFVEGRRYRISFDIIHEDMFGMRVRVGGEPAPGHGGPWVCGDIVNNAEFQAGNADTFGYLPAHFTGFSPGKQTFTVEFTFTNQGLTALPARGDYWAVITGSQQRNDWSLEGVRVEILG